MKCKKHPVDLSSAVGVCATCLRERLFALIAAQAQAEALTHARPRARPCAADDRLEPDPQPPPHQAFPHSVSPYISHRKSDAAVCARGGGGGGHHRFYSTPQVGPAYRYSDAVGGFVPSEPRKKKRGKFSLLAILFSKSRSEKFDSELGPRFSLDSDPGHRGHRDSCRATPASSSWFSFLHRRGKSQPRGFSAEDSVSAFESRRPRPVSNRGMSPERGEESDDEDRENRSPLGSGYASESSRGPRRTPARRAAASGADGAALEERLRAELLPEPAGEAEPRAAVEPPEVRVPAGDGVLRRNQGPGAPAPVDGGVVPRQPVPEASGLREGQPQALGRVVRPRR
ncbi:uncharacterized protein LOC125314445 [Rhodamnia argentea]|uniref:Uncharacterized protein LOC125314445 n=1 Tax=Rhodamnia argentea TaxID=178133 RepID=A0ABM3H7W5_9MYRT|nr:uncharacterized protein LOC125314445 [Rhodamnia argentea]